MKSSRRSRLKKQHGDFWSLAEIEQLGRVPDSVLAKRTGRSLADIAKERQSAHCPAHVGATMDSQGNPAAGHDERP